MTRASAVLETSENPWCVPLSPDPYVVAGLHLSNTRNRSKERKLSSVSDDASACAREGIMDTYARARIACFAQLIFNQRICESSNRTSSFSGLAGRPGGS